MTKNRIWLLLFGATVLVLASVVGTAGFAQFLWNRQDYRADASNIISRQLAEAHPGYKPALLVRLYGENDKSREVCIYEMKKNNAIINIWSIEYTRTIPRPLMHQLYTPKWPKNGEISQDLCLNYAAEPPPHHVGKVEHDLPRTF